MKNYPVNESLLKDDLYMAVNEEWLKTAKIPSDKSSTGGFADLADNIEKLLMTDFSKLSENDKDISDPYLNEFIKYYQLASDFKKREEDGFKPAIPFLKKIENLKDLADFKSQLKQLTLEGYPTPFPLGVEPDMKNTNEYVLYAGVPSLILPDKTYYTENNEQAKLLLSVYRSMVKKLFSLAGYTEEFTKNTLDLALKFDASLAPHQKDSTQRADYTKNYNPFSLDEFAKFNLSIDLKAYATQMIGLEPKKVIVTEPKFYKALNKLVNEDTFSALKSWMLVKSIIGVSAYLTDQARITSGEYLRAVSGAKEAMSPKKAAFYLASDQFSQVVGLYYGHKYFGKKAKEDVYNMVVSMIKVYKKRLEKNDWLSDSTRKKAIVKLDALGIHVGYPEKLNELFKKFKVNQNLSLLENDLAFTKISLLDHFSRYNKKVDRTLWEMPAHMVNAYYNPAFNVIVFPAAILQAPFYSLKQPSSANFGGIGAVIAHEISHAFDNNGAKFDEFGNLNNWWEKDDFNHFEKLAQAMIEQFDGLKTPAGRVNGKLVVSENIADAGGLSCALEAAKSQPDFNARIFFENWARIWCLKSSLERQKLLLSIDVHSPHILRANVQPKNLDDFYTTFDIKEGDKMFLPKDKRIKIW